MNEAFDALPTPFEMAETFSQIHTISWKAAYHDCFPAPYLNGFTPEKRAEIFRRNYGVGEERPFLFHHAGTPKGIAILGPSWECEYPEDIGEICAFYTLPETWGTGFAQDGMRFCLRYFHEQGYQGAILWVLETNRRARRFYEKAGFRPDGTHKEFQLDKTFSELRYYMKL